MNNITVSDIEQFVNEAGSDNVSVFGGKFEGGAHIQQVPDEIAPCIHAILESGKEIRSYLEIGVAAGGTTYLFNHFFHPRKMVLVDDNKHCKASLRSTILGGIGSVRGVIGNPQDAGVIREAAGKYDLIIIDGDHSYEGVNADLKNYLPMLSGGGFLILHDSACPDWGVMQVTRELMESGDMEFVGEYLSKTRSTPLGVALFRKVSS